MSESVEGVTEEPGWLELESRSKEKMLSMFMKLMLSNSVLVPYTLALQRFWGESNKEVLDVVVDKSGEGASLLDGEPK